MEGGGLEGGSREEEIRGEEVEEEAPVWRAADEGVEGGNGSGVQHYGVPHSARAHYRMQAGVHSHPQGVSVCTGAFELCTTSYLYTSHLDE